MRDNMSEPLHVFYKRFMKLDITKDNAAEMFTVATQKHAIFYFSSNNDAQRAILAQLDFVKLWAALVNIPWFDPWYVWCGKVVHGYPIESWRDPVFVQAMLDGLTDARDKCQAILQAEGLPPL